MTEDIGIALNTLAREQMKYRLLRDIRLDLQVCELEGIDPREYIRELLTLIAGIADSLAASDYRRAARRAT